MPLPLYFRHRKRNTKYLREPPGDNQVPYHDTLCKDQTDLAPLTPVAQGCSPHGQRAPPEHSHYTHVWELRSAPMKAPPDVACQTLPNRGSVPMQGTIRHPQSGTLKLAGIHHERPTPFRTFCGGILGQHPRDKNHIYESPKFERCPACPHPTIPRDPRDPAFFSMHHDHPHHHHMPKSPQNPQSPCATTQGININNQHSNQSSHMGQGQSQGQPLSGTARPDEIPPITSDESDEECHQPQCEIRFSKGVGYRPVPAGPTGINQDKNKLKT